MLKRFSPAEVSELTGLTVETLRDWRRRGLLVGVGGIDLPEGGIACSLDHPALVNVGRPAWTYSGPDLLRLWLARHAVDGYGLELARALRLSDLAAQLLDGWLTGDHSHRYLLARPASNSPAPKGEADRRALAEVSAPAGGFAMIRLADISRLPVFAGESCLILDLLVLSERLPRPVRVALGY